MRLRAVIFLITFYFTYLLVGALIFYALEFASEEQRCLEAIAEIRRYNLSATEENITVEDFRSLVQVKRFLPRRYELKVCFYKRIFCYCLKFYVMFAFSNV